MYGPKGCKIQRFFIPQTTLACGGSYFSSTVLTLISRIARRQIRRQVARRRQPVALPKHVLSTKKKSLTKTRTSQKQKNSIDPEIQDCPSPARRHRCQASSARCLTKTRTFKTKIKNPVVSPSSPFPGVVSPLPYQNTYFQTKKKQY